MKLLFGQNLSYRLCRNLGDVFPDSEQTARAGLAEADDQSVWAYARRHGQTIVTHDADFAEIAALRGPPPKIIWLRCGNQPMVAIERLLRERAKLIESFLEDRIAVCLELYSRGDRDSRRHNPAALLETGSEHREIRMRSTLVATAVLYSAIMVPAAAGNDTPVAVAQKFCETHLPGTFEAERAAMELLTPSLRAAMAEAEKKNADWEAAHPGEKPPLGDGVPFQSYPDTPKECVAGNVSADRTEVDIEYRFDDPEANWTDRVKLAEVGGRLLVDDIFYGVNGFQDSLRDSLASVGKDVEIEE